MPGNFVGFGAIKMAKTQVGNLSFHGIYCLIECLHISKQLMVISHECIVRKVHSQRDGDIDGDWDFSVWDGLGLLQK